MSVVLACAGPLPNDERDAWIEGATRFAAAYAAIRQVPPAHVLV